MYYVINSKQVVNFLGDSGLYGYYYDVKDWLLNKFMEFFFYLENDCVVIFDNN